MEEGGKGEGGRKPDYFHDEKKGGWRYHVLVYCVGVYYKFTFFQLFV